MTIPGRAIDQDRTRLTGRFASSSNVGFQKRMHHAIDGLRQIVGLLIKRYAQRHGQGVSKSGADQFPGPNPRVQRATENTRLLAVLDDLSQQSLVVEVELTQKRCDFGVVRFHERAVHDAKLACMLTGTAEVEIDDAMELGQRLGDVERFLAVAEQGGFANL